VGVWWSFLALLQQQQQQQQHQYYQQHLHNQQRQKNNDSNKNNKNNNKKISRPRVVVFLPSRLRWGVCFFPAACFFSVFVAFVGLLRSFLSSLRGVFSLTSQL
jgi:hypothetical protein